MQSNLLFTVVLITTLLILPCQASAQGTIEGTVRDSDGNPLPGVNVALADHPLGAATDLEGIYRITDVPPEPVIVEARFVGFRTRTERVTVPDGETVVVDFTLREAALNLDEVVVTGAGGPVEKRRLGNTIGTISAEAVEEAPVSSFSDVLQGREPGLVGLPSSGSTGEGARIRIRGSASLSQSNEPIVFVDGVRVDQSGGFGGFVDAGGAGSPSRLDDINPRAIERVEVLKGAAAATLYGTEASNGVIQVFTKRGQVSEPQISLTMRQGVSTYPRVIPDNAGFARTTAQADTMSRYYGGSIQPYELVRQNYVQDLFETGHAQEYGASVRGGSEGVTYYVNGRWTKENGPLYGNGVPFNPGNQAQAQDILERLQGNAQVNIFPYDALQLRVSMGFTDTDFETFQTGNNINGVVSGAMHGKPELVGYNNRSGSSYVSSLQERLQQTVLQSARSFNTSLGFNYRPLETLTLDGTFGLDYTDQGSESIRPYGWNINNFTGTEVNGARRTSDRSFVSTTIDLKATLNHDLGTRFSSTFIGGVQHFLTQTTLRSGLARDFPGPGLSVSGAASEQEIDEILTEESQVGVFAQEQIGLDDFLFVTVGGRYDAHSAFGSNFSGIFYPKISTSAVLSDAPFWSPIGPLSSVRLRAAIGRSGLQPGTFDALTTYASENSALGPGIVPENLGNADLKPEISTEWEVGLDLGLWADRVAVEATYWDRTVRDALVARQFPVTGGFLEPQLDNIGQLSGRGLELSISGQALDRANLSVNLFANAAYLWEEVTSLGGAPPLKVGGSYPRYRQFLIEGYAPGAHFGAKLQSVPEGFVPLSRRGLLEELGRDASGVGADAPASQELVRDYLATLTPENAALGDLNGFVLLADADGDGDPLDHHLGKPMPDWQGAFGTRINFLQHFRLSTLFEYRFGNFYINDLTGGFRQRSAGIGRNTPATARVERDFVTGGVNGDFEPQNDPEVRLAATEQWLNEYLALAPFSGLNSIRPGDFLRLREVSLTYTLPPSVTTPLQVNHLSLTVSGRNLWLATRYKGVDPEVNAIGRGGGDTPLAENFLMGTDAWNLPLQRQFNVQLQVRF
jgi:TonB-linked SusC/RagA family outer membrane protein